MTDLKKLRELAEKVIESKPTGTGSEWRIHYDYEKAANPQAILALLDRLKEAEEIVRWLADGGPCWSVHSRTMEPTFSHSEQATARAYLEKWKVEMRLS